MRISPRIVVDTNILVSALLSIDSIPGQAFRKAKQEGLILMSEATWNELARVLSRRKFDHYVSTQIRREFMEALDAVDEYIVVSRTVLSCRDPKDNMILELAINGEADLIITGDQDLLALGSFHGIPIWTPAQYLAQ